MESDNPWAAYLEAMNKCWDAVKLTAFHTRECAGETEKAATQVSLTAYHVQAIVQQSTVIPYIPAGEGYSKGLEDT